MSEQLNQKNVTEMKALALNYKSACNAELLSIDLPKISSGKVLIRSLFSGISRGTENLVFWGLVPENQWEIMRCPHQRGAFSFPVSYGYCCVGEVQKVADDVKHVKTGDFVFVLHPHQDRFIVDEGMCTIIPNTVPVARAVLSANMETALNGVWDGEIEAAKTFAVIGAGVVGLLVGYVLKHQTGITPVIIDINAEKRKIAEAFGLKFRTVDEMSGETQSFQRIFNTSASGPGLQLAIDMADFEARIVEMSWFGSKEVNIQLGGNFHSRRLQIISSQVGHIAPSKRETHTYADRMAEVMKLLQNEVLDQLLEPKIAFSDLPDKVHDIFNEKGSALCQLVQYRS